jgi:hypothetical protein
MRRRGGRFRDGDATPTAPENAAPFADGHLCKGREPAFMLHRRRAGATAAAASFLGVTRRKLANRQSHKGREAESALFRRPRCGDCSWKTWPSKDLPLLASW